MTVYQLPDETSFIKQIVEQGQGLHTPNEGSKCKIIISLISSSCEYPLDKSLYADLISFDEEIIIHLGFYRTIIGNYIHKCLFTMKSNELAELSFDCCPNPAQNRSLISFRISLRLLSFERHDEIYSMPIETLYKFALEHKQNANQFFQAKNFRYALKLYHRALCYASNMTCDESNIDNHDDLLVQFDQLVVSIYTNIAACQLIFGNNPGVIANCSSALDLDPVYVKALFRRGCAYANMNDFELALVDLNMANRLEPNDVKVEQLLKDTKQRFEQYEKSLGQSLKKLF